MSWPMLCRRPSSPVFRTRTIWALRREVRAVQGGVDGLKPCVAIGAVDARVKVGVKRHGVAEARELEVGSVGLAVDGEVAQSALVTSGRIEDAGDAFEDGQIGVVEGVVAADWAAAGVGNDPRSKAAGGWMAPGGVGLCKLRVEVHGRAWAHPFELEMADGKFQRQLVGLVGFDGQACVGAVDGVDHER